MISGEKIFSGMSTGRIFLFVMTFLLVNACMHLSSGNVF